MHGNFQLHCQVPLAAPRLARLVSPQNLRFNAHCWHGRKLSAESKAWAQLMPDEEKEEEQKEGGKGPQRRRALLTRRLACYPHTPSSLGRPWAHTINASSRNPNELLALRVYNAAIVIMVIHPRPRTPDVYTSHHQSQEWNNLLNTPRPVTRRGCRTVLITAYLAYPGA